MSYIMNRVNNINHTCNIDGMATINLRLPDDLRDQYKVYCALKRITMRDDLIAYIAGATKAITLRDKKPLSRGIEIVESYLKEDPGGQA